MVTEEVTDVVQELRPICMGCPAMAAPWGAICCCCCPWGGAGAGAMLGSIVVYAVTT